MKNDYKYEIDTTIDNYRVRLCKSYYQLIEIKGSMEGFLRGAEDHPADITKDDAIEVREFLVDLREVLQDYESLFNKFDD